MLRAGRPLCTHLARRGFCTQVHSEHKVKLAALYDGMSEFDVVEWYKVRRCAQPQSSPRRLRCSQAEGDFVEKGQPLLKVETEEVSADIDSDWTG